MFVVRTLITASIKKHCHHHLGEKEDQYGCEEWTGSDESLN